MRDPENAPNTPLVTLTRANAVAIVELSRPRVHNALSAELLRQLLVVIDSLGKSSDVRVMVLASKGTAVFCAGGDIRHMSAMSQAAALDYIATGKSCAQAIEMLPFPTLAAVHGAALGGGLELALACDAIAAESTALLGLPEVKLGIIPGFGGIPRLVRRIGYSRAKSMVLRGEVVSGSQARDWGLIDVVCEPGAVRSTSLEWAEDLCRMSASALSAAKQALADAADLDFETALLAESKHFMSAFGSADRSEGLSAFIDKRAPDFKSSP